MDYEQGLNLPREVLTVSELNSIAKEALEMMVFWVEGEVTSFKPHEAERYYYVYFTLQDSNVKAAIPCAMRRDAYFAANTPLENGQKVILQGKLSLFTQSGKTAFMVNQIEVAGQGKLAAELEKLKAKLQTEGLLSAERKRPLPQLPQRIGVVTAVNSDAWADFQRHSIAKFPVMELIVVDSFVQGVRAPVSLVNAIEAMQSQPIDVLVITRGGGSAEDLAAFNDERVVRAIAASRIPTLVGVGHEKDISIADLVADVRASTPTNAGQILTRGYEEVQIQLEHHEASLYRLHTQKMERMYQLLDDLSLGLARTRQKYQSLPYQLTGISAKLDHHYHRLLDSNTVLVAAMREKLYLSSQHFSQMQQARLTSLERQLSAVSPLNVLSRGFSIVTVNGKIVRTSHQVKQGDTMQVQLSKGGLKGLITKIDDLK